MPYKQNRKDEYAAGGLPQHTDWLTIDQAASYLQINREGLRKLRKAGVVTEHRLGNFIRFSKKQLDEVLANSTVND